MDSMNDHDDSPYHPLGEEGAKALFTVQRLVWITAIITMLALLLPEVTPQLVYNNFFKNYLGLSLDGISSFHVWQIFTYLFLETNLSIENGVLSILLLFLNLYFLWSIGAVIALAIGRKRFLSFYFTIGALAGVAILFTQYLSGINLPYIGNIAPLSGLLFLWAMIRPAGEMLLLFSFQMTSRTLVVSLLSFQSFLFWLSGGTCHLVALGVGVLSAYLYGVIFLKLRGIFPVLYPIEDYLRFQYVLWGYKRRQAESRVYDIQSKSMIIAPDDSIFVDLILDKISKYGQESLTWRERRRMQQIAERKRQEKLNNVNGL